VAATPAGRSAAGLAAGRRSAPVLSIPPAPGAASSSSPASRSPVRPAGGGGAHASQRPGAGGRSSRPLLDAEPGEDEENFFQLLGHRVKNSIDTFDTPKWLQDIKKPKWMGGDGDAEDSSQARPSANRGDSDFRRWFGGGGGSGSSSGEGRIRL
jgi:hypothetical protein